MTTISTSVPDTNVASFERFTEIERRLSTGEIKLVFIVGMPRSGTTWLSRLLAEHSACINLRETKLFDYYLSRIPRGLRKYESFMYEGIHQACPTEEFLQYIRQLVLQTIFASLSLSQGPTIFVEKTPDNWRYQDFIRKLVPEAYFITLLRDPRSVFASYNAAASSWAWDKDWARTSPMRLAKKWKKMITTIEELNASHDRSLRVRYEDLSLNTVPTIRLIYEWLEIFISEEQCENAARNCTLEKLGGIDRAKARNVDKLFWRRGEVAGWHRELSPFQIAAVEYPIRDEMPKSGYSLNSNSLILAPMAMLGETFGRVHCFIGRKIVFFVKTILSTSLGPTLRGLYRTLFR